MSGVTLQPDGAVPSAKQTLSGVTRIWRVIPDST